MSIEIIDNFLPEEHFRPLQRLLMGDNFDWYYNDFINHPGEEKSPHPKFQFTHAFFRPPAGICSPHFSALNPCFEALKATILVRVKANLGTITETVLTHEMHTDHDFNCKTAILYMNTNNGFTLLNDGSVVLSKENRILIFDSNILHTGTTCTDSKIRVVINFNYFPATIT
jgi:hypothetical protein